MKTRRLFTLVALGVIIAIVFSISISAASGLQGYVVYRDGAGFNIDWHAAMVVKPSLSTDINPIVHTTNSLNTVIADTWDDFLDGNEYHGVYTISGIYTSSDRDVIVEDTLWLTEYDIPYTLPLQVDYSVSDVSGNYVMPRHIEGMRCDGVVEYVFELNDFRIYGSDNYWDVTYKSSSNKQEHSILQVTPSIQAGLLIYCHDEVQ